jgi:hypothetical protein
LFQYSIFHISLVLLSVKIWLIKLTKIQNKIPFIDVIIFLFCLDSNDSVKQSPISQPTTPGGNGNVLRKVANAEKQHLTPANGEKRVSRILVPEKLNFAVCDNFEGKCNRKNRKLTSSTMRRDIFPFF